MGSKGGSGGGSNQMGFQATTSTYTPNPEAMQAYRQAIGMAENVASIPYEAYQGQMTAGFTPDQLAAFQGTREMQGMAQPYINAATSAVNQSLSLADPRNFTPAALQQYYNPYQQNVIESSKAMMAQQNAQQQADLTARAIQQGAYGGDRSGVARAALMGQQNLANQQILAGLQQQGYQQAVGQYNQQQQQAIGAAQQGAYSLGQLGLQGQQAALQGIQALLGTGGMQQNLAQQQLSAAYNQWLQARAYPYQQANFYSGIVSGIAPNMGGTTNTMGIGNSQTQQQQASGGGGGAGMLTSALSFLPMLFGSDRRDKTDIQYLGKDESGEKIYSYRYKGDPKSYPKVVGPMAQDIEKHDPDRVHEIGGHKVIEGLGHLSSDDRDGYANGGSSIYSSSTVDPNAYQQSPYEANQAFDPGFKTGLEAVIDPAMANQIARSRWVSQHPDDQSQSQQTLDEQMQYRNPEFNLFPYFQDGQQSSSPFDGNAEKPQMYADGGGVGGLGDLMKAKTPFGAANDYVEALPITPGRAHIPEPPRMNWLPGLPGGGPSGGGGGGGGGSGGGGGMPKLPKMGGSKAASAGAASPQAEAAAASPEAGSSAPTPEAATATPAAEAAAAPDMGAAAAPAMDAGLGGLGGGIGDIFSGLGGMFPMFSHGGRIHKDDGGAASGPAGAMGSSGFAGALGAGVGAIPGLIGEEGTGTLGSLMPSFKAAPTKGPMGDMSYKGWLDRAMMLDPGPQTTPEEQGQPSLPKPGSQAPRPFMPGEMQSQVVGEQNKGIDPMLMMGMGKMGGNLAMSTMLSNQQAADDAKSLQQKYQQKRADILATPQAPAGYSQSLASNIVNPHTGLFNVKYGTYYMPHYAEGGRVNMADGGNPSSYTPSARDLDYWARTVAREAIDQGDKGMAAVAYAIKNRLESGKYGRSIADVVTARNQFTPWNPEKRGTKADPRRMDVNSPDYKKAMEIVQGVASGKIANPIGSAVNFANPALSGQKALRTWINPMIRSGNAIRIGEHVFGTPAGAAPGARRYAMNAPYGSPFSTPTKTLAVHPVTGERPVVASDATASTQKPMVQPQTLPSSSTLPRINPADPSGPLLGQPPIPPSAAPRTAPAELPKGMGFASLINPMGTAHADEAGPSMPEGVIPRIRPGFESIQGPSQLAGLQATKQLSPTSLNPAMGTPKTGISGLDMASFTPPGMAGDRDLMGATPQGFGTFAPSDFGPEASKPSVPWESPVVSNDDATAAPARTPAPKPAERAAPEGEKGGKFWGDYRDYEPWASDPIGKALDDIVGEKPMSSHKGASMWDVGGGETTGGGFDLGDLGDLFKQYGGRVNMADGGDPLAGLDPEMFSDEPMAPQSAGFDESVINPPEDTSANEDRVVATDMPDRQAPTQQQGFGGLRSPITGQPMVWGPASQALLAAGLGMMASDRVNPLQAIGEGGLRGLEYYQSASAQERAQQAADERIRHERAKERADELYRQNALELRRNIMESQERARAAAEKRLIENQQRLEMQADPAYKAKVAQEAAEAKKLADIGIKSQEDAMAAQGNIQRLTNFEKALEEGRFRTGTGASAELALRRGFNALGFGDEEAIQLAGDFESGAVKDLLSAAGGSLGVGISNTDAKMLSKMSTSLGKSPAENLSAIRAAKAVEQRKIEVAEFQRQYRDTHGGVLDSNYYNELAKWAINHPLTATLGQTPEKSGSSETGKKVVRTGKTRDGRKVTEYSDGTVKYGE